MSSETLLYRNLLNCKKVFWFVFFFSCIINILTMFMPIYTMQILDRVVTSGSVDTLILLTIITFIATVTMIVLEGLRNISMQKVGEWLEMSMSDELILRALALTAINPSTSGSQILRDMGSIRTFVSSYILIALFDAPWACLFFVLMLIINIKIAIIALIGLIVVALLAAFNEFFSAKTLKTINDLQVKNYTDIEIAIRNAEIVESMGMGKAIVKLWKQKNKTVSDLQDRANFFGTITSSLSKLLKIILNTFILAGGIYFSLSTHQTVGGILACSMLMSRVMTPIDILISGSKQISAARTSYARLQQILTNVALRNSSMELPKPIGNIECAQVIYTPLGAQKPTLKGISCNIPAGKCISIIGPSGCGKSTLAKLLVGVWKPLGGVIRLDGADVYTWNRDFFGKYVGYLPQDVELFHVTIKENIARLSDEIDPEKIVNAAKIAGVHELILSLPNGYDTVYGPGKCILSGGQKQRIALARAFYGDIKFLVLDEPNSNLDQFGEQCLMNALIWAKQQGITVIFTTHKFNLLGVADTVFVMQDGLIVAHGSPQEILAKLQPQAVAATTQNSQEQKEDK